MQTKSALRQRGMLLLAGVCLTGCGAEPTPLHPLAAEPAPAPALGARFDPAECGTVRGRVLWSGSKPISRSFRDAGVHPGSFADGYDAINPLFPRIHAESGGVAEAVVFLRRVDPERCRPWDLPPVRIVMNAGQIVAEQNGSHVAGFVHAGDPVEMISADQSLELLRARGAAFFTLPFPEPNKPLTRKLTNSGLVELSSAAGHFWARSWLFVVEHPYFARTDALGNFQIDRIPDGVYELVCWLPDWRVERFERDPETFAPARVWFRQPLEKSMAVRVESGKMNQVDFSVGTADFGK